MNGLFETRLGQLRVDAAREHALAIQDMKRLVELETPSKDVSALSAAATWIQDWIEDSTGPSVRVERIDHDNFGPTLIARIPGDRPGRAVVVGHYDTVWPRGTIQDIPFSVRSGVLRGPGVLDMKAGLVTAVRAVGLAQRHGLPLPDITFVLNGDEELGSPVSRTIIEREAHGATVGLVAEPGVEWDIKIERKGIGVFAVETEGIEAHPGNDPENGANAVHAMAELVTQLAAATDLQAGTHVNVGLLSGGTARNVIAGSACAEVDVRIANHAEAERIDHVLAGLTASDPRVQVRVTGRWNRPPMTLSEGSRDFVEHVQSIARPIRGELGLRSVGGGSDANFIAAIGVPVIDGLGASGAGPHARHEHVLEKDIDDRILLMCGILAEAV